MKISAKPGETTRGDFYVAPDGSDDNPGTIESPFATLERARDAVREKIAAGLEKDIVVLVRGGRYQLKSPLVFGSEDSGTEKYSITYAAFPGESPCVSGGEIIDGWQGDDNGIYKAETSLSFRQLYVDGERAVRARMPNGPDNYYRLKKWDVENKTIVVDSAQIRDWDNFKRVEMVIQQRWAESIVRLDSYEVSGDEAQVAIQNPERDIVFPRPHPWKMDSQPYHFENAYEFLTEAGEWYLNVDTQTLYYKPRAGEDISKIEVIAPAIETLVKIEGSFDSPVRNINFRGLTFEHSTWTRPSSSGMIDAQAGMYNVKVEKENDQYVGRPAACVYVVAADNIRFERNIFRHIGAAGLDLHYGATNSEIIGNTFFDISGNAVQMAKYSDETVEFHTNYEPEDRREICENNVISNNLIAAVAQDYYGSVGIACGWVRRVKIEHNEITDMPYSAISIGWGWCQVPNSVVKENMIRYNHIHHVVNLLGDAAAIYTLSPQLGSEISNNYIHDIVPSQCTETQWEEVPIGGIYLDEGSEGFEIHHNVLDNIPYIFINNQNRPGNKYYDNFGFDKAGHLYSENIYTFYYDGEKIAKSIMENAGLEPAYKDIKLEYDRKR